MNEILKNLTIQNFKNFKNSFEESKNIFWDEKNRRLRHSAEYGSFREDLVKKWLRIVVPEKFGISSGFLISSTGAISTQCDIIIYDKTRTPKIENIDDQRFFPCETVSCIGEVKSDVNSIRVLNSYLIKLSDIKKIRSTVIDPDPYYRGSFETKFNPDQNSFDNIYSFLICNKFKFNFQPAEINYGDIEQRFKHNVILSLQDGLVNYKTNEGTPNLSMPFAANQNHLNNYLKCSDAEFPEAILVFLTSLHMALNFNSLLNIDMTQYLSDNVIKKIH